MHIIEDLNGHLIEVIDLDKAIEQATMFMGFRHADTSFIELDRNLHAYWTHLLEQLLRIRTEINNESGKFGGNT